MKIKWPWRKKRDNREIVNDVLRCIQPQLNKLIFNHQIMVNEITAYKEENIPHKIRVIEGNLNTIAVQLAAIRNDLHPPMRLRLEQLDTALKIQVKFLNEIWDEVKSHGG